MKNIIERYIYAVTRRLPEEMREEVKEELNGNIYDMLSQNPTDEEIDKVLHELGHPRELAKNYRGHDRYVVSPLFYDDYIQVLKIVSIVILAITLTFGTFESIINIESVKIIGMIAEVMGDIVGNVFTAFATAFFWVTLIFCGIDYAARNNKFPEWKLKDLPEIPKPNTTKISRVESVVGLILGTIFSAIFIVLLMRYVELLGIYEDGVMVSQLLNKEVTDKFIIFFGISAAFGILVNLLKLNFGEWRLSLAIVYTIDQMISIVLMVLFLRADGLILNEAFVKISSYFDTTAAVIQDHFNRGVVGLIVFVSVLVAIDLIITWVKTMKGRKA